MSGRLGHVARDRRVGHVPVNGIRLTNYAYGFGGCKFWLDAGSGTPSQTNGSAISFWIEKIRNLRFAQNTAGSQPAFVLNDASFNNLPTINTSSNRFLTLASDGLLLTADDTVAVVAKYDTINQGNIVMGNSAGALQAIILGGTAGGYTGIGWRNNAGTFFASTIENTNPHISVMTLTDIYVDGASALNNNSNTTFPDALLNQVGIGLGSNTITSLNGKIAEIIVWNRKFSTTEMAQLSTILNAKYAIY